VPGTAARFFVENGVAVDSAGNLYVPDASNNSIRKLTPTGTNWAVKTIAGLVANPGSADGTNRAARFNFPMGLAIDSAGTLYVADTDNYTVRKMMPAGTNWVVTTIAGRAGSFGSVDGTNGAARFGEIFGMAVDSAGTLYAPDGSNDSIRKLTATGTNWAVTTIAGLAGNPGSVDGTGNAARFNFPYGIATDSTGSVYVSDAGNGAIRKLMLVGTNWVATTVAGPGGIYGSADGTGREATFRGPSSVAIDREGSVYVADTGNHTIRKMTFAGEVTTLAGLAGYPGSANGSGTVARFGGPSGVAIDAAGNVYVAEDNSTIRKITSAGMVTTLAGLAGNEGSVDGTGSAARFAEPQGVALDSATNIYVADTFNNTVRRVTPSGSVTTRAGSPEFGGSADGIGSSARFNHPTGVSVDSSTNVYVADTWNHTIRKMTPARLVTTIAGVAGSSGSVDGIGKAARFDRPSGMAVDSAGNLYVADTYNNSIRKLTPVGTNWVVTTLGGMSGFYGTADGAGSAARFSNPNGVAVDSAGNLYVADFYFNTIRKGYPPPKLLNLSFVPGQFRFDLTAPPGHSVVVEASPDLASWLPIWTNTSPLNFSDPQTGVYSHRFYRSVAIAP
jgi:sugar lactone lactonase YvrE